MSAADTEYAARFVGPELIERGRANALTCPVYRDGALVAPTELTSSITILRKDGSAVVSAGPVAVTGSIARYTTGTYTAEQLEEGWFVEWLCTIGGVPYRFRRSAALCRARLHPVITDADLYARHAELADVRGTLTTDQACIDEAWAELLNMIRQKGSLPHLVMSPEDLRFAHLFLALSNRFLDLQTSGGNDSKWAALATHYATRFTQAFGGLSFRYDTDDDGVADVLPRAGFPITFLGGHGRDPWRRGGRW